MKKFDEVRKRLLEEGVKEDNIDYAISAIKDGTRRMHIIETLCADYRGMNELTANEMLNDLYEVYGGEFKKESRGGYIYAAFFLMIGLALDFYLFYFYTFGGALIYPIYVWIFAIVFTIGGILYLVRALTGKHRDEDDPFNESQF